MTFAEALSAMLAKVQLEVQAQRKLNALAEALRACPELEEVLSKLIRKDS